MKELTMIVKLGSWYTVYYLENEKSYKCKVNGWQQLEKFLKENKIYHVAGQPLALPVNNYVVTRIVLNQTLKKAGY